VQSVLFAYRPSISQQQPHLSTRARRIDKMATSTGVNVPTNTKIKEKDVNAKLQLYGIYSGLSWRQWLATASFALRAL
jgi:hypothetical protein